MKLLKNFVNFVPFVVVKACLWEVRLLFLTKAFVAKEGITGN